MTKTPKDEDEVASWIRSRFAFARLRERQAEVILGLLQGRRVVFVAPTGHGKSLCYQALAASPWSQGVVLVLEPLKALMVEQVEKAQAVGLRAAFVNSDLEPDAQRHTLEQAVAGQLDLLFVSPERLDNDTWQALVPQMRIKGVVVDEAHCISQWGHDFRPAYQRLVRITSGLGRRTPVLAVTATAPGEVVADIEDQLRSDWGGCTVIRLPSYRPNIALSAIEMEGFAGRLAVLLDLARRMGSQPGLAYFLTTGEAKLAAAFLNSQGIAAVAYHGKLDTDRRTERLSDWKSEEATVICATSALGMGMDRADLRWVAHLGLPDSLIRYVQEIGRAGRDGQPAWAIAVHDPETRAIHDWLKKGTSPDPQERESIVQLLRLGPKHRNQLVEATDIPSADVQAILDELVHLELAVRTGQPLLYSWVGSPGSYLPPDHVKAQELREARLAEVFRYQQGADCRARQLAAAMSDQELPSPCGACDRCATWPVWGTEPTLTAAADAFLAGWQPPIDDRTQGGSGQRLLEQGVALSVYDLGAIGKAVKKAKYERGAVTADIMQAARLALARAPLLGLRFEAVVSVPSSAGLVDSFAGELALILGTRHVRLRKTKETRPQKDIRSRELKADNARDSLGIPLGAAVLGPVLLVDDMWDSGLTIKAAARALRRAAQAVGGTCRVYPLVLAKTRDAKDES